MVIYRLQRWPDIETTVGQHRVHLPYSYAVKSENVEDYWWATTSRGEGAGPVFSYKLRYIVDFWLVEMAISTNQKPTIYHNLYENTGPEELLYNFSVFLHHVHGIHFNIGIPKWVYTQLVYMQLKVIYHPLYGMNNYVHIWGDWLSCDPLRGSHDSQSPHIWGDWLSCVSQRVTITPYKETLVPHLVVTLIYLAHIYSYYIRKTYSIQCTCVYTPHTI